MSDGRTWGAVVGAVAGYFTGGLSYIGTGIAVGSAVGGLLEPKKHTETGRVDDIKVSLSKYGDGIPETVGNNIPSATCVWSTFIIELPEEEQGGKGGGGTANTNYRQFIESMWCLGKTPPPGTTITLRKAWIDGKLNYDSSQGLSASQALATEENPWASIALLPGFDDQLPVPMIETYEGVGNVPAFRGRICLFIFGLECPGGRVPQLQFELCFNAELVDDIHLGEEVVIETGEQISASRMASDGNTSTFFAEYADGTVGHQTKRVAVYSLGLEGATLLNEFAMGDEYWGIYTSLFGDADIDAICFRRVSSVDNVDSEYNVVVDTEGVVLKSFLVGADCLAFGQGLSSWSKRGEFFLISGDNLTPDRVKLFGWDSTTEIAATDIAGQAKVLLTDAAAWVLVGGTSPNTLQAHELEPAFTLIDGVSLPAETAGLQLRLTSRDGDTLILWAANESTGNLLYVYTVSLEASSIVFTVRNETVRLDGAIPHPIEENIGAGTNSVLGWERLSVGVDTNLRAFMIVFDRVQPAPASVADFIESQNLRAGLAADQFDVSTIDDSFWGLTLKNPASARANITPVMTYSALGVVEEDGMLKYFNRADKTSVVTIPYEELGCAEDGSESGDPFPLLHTNSQELSKSLTLTFNDRNFDYQQSTVKAFFPSVSVGADDSEVLDMAIDGGRAATICRRILLERRRSQNTRSFSISRAYAYLSAGDVATFLSRDGSYGDWMISKLTDTGAKIEGECFPADSDLLIQTVPGPSAYRAQQIEPLAPQTRMVIGDWPLLRDADNNPGIYTAFDRLGTGGRGATLFVGPDDSSLEDRGTVFAYTTIATAMSVLGDWSLNIFDQSNTITVNAPSDAFASVTYDALIADSTLNACAFGKPGRWEILQFGTASYLGDNVWLIYDFLRGQRGTEHNRGNHQSGDQLVFLRSSAMLRPNMDVGGLNQSKKYRAVSLGRSINSAASQSYVNTGERLRPFSPVNLLHEFDGTDVAFTWNRRTRLSNNWLAGVVPLGEAAEAYALTLYTDNTFSTVQRVLPPISSPTATYTAAQMAADSYTPGDPLYVRVQQISDTVGAGHELEETL